MDDTITRIRTKLARLRADERLAATVKPAALRGHLNPPASEAEVEAFEREQGVITGRVGVAGPGKPLRPGPQPRGVVGGYLGGRRPPAPGHDLRREPGV